MSDYDDGRTVNSVVPLRPRYDRDGDIYVLCDCNARRYIREAPMTECSKCGAHYSFYVKQVAPPIGSR